MNERQEQQMIASAQLGADMRDFCKHVGFAVLMKFINSKVADSRNEWLSAPTPQFAEEIRLKAKPYAEIEAYLKKLIIEGDVANQNLTRSRQEDL
jgi:hypothetical protein